MVDLNKIPVVYRAAYLKRESDYTKKDLDWFYSLSENNPLKEIARRQVLKKREKFYNMWLEEYNKQNPVNESILFKFLKRVFNK